MTHVAFANVVGHEFAPQVRLSGRRRSLDKVVRKHTKHLGGAPFMVSLHQRGDVLKPSENTVWLEKFDINYPGRTWADAVVTKHDVVLITVLPAGGGGGGGAAKIGLTVAAIALMVLAPYAAPFLSGGAIAAGTLANSVITAGIMVGGGALIAAVARSQQAKNTKLYGVSGGGNLGRANERIPVGYGRYWTSPDLAQPDWFDYEGDDMTLFKRMVVGCGKYRIKNIRVGQTTLWSETGTNGLPGGGVITAGVTTAFTGTSIEIIKGTQSVLVPGDVISSASVSGQTLPLSNHSPAISGPWVVTPVGVDINKLQVDYSFPAGYIKSNTGTTLPIDLWFEYAPIDAGGTPTGAWQTLYRYTNGAYKLQGAKRFTKYLDVPLGRYAVRGRNNDPDMGVDNEAKYQRNISWDALRGHTPDTRVRAGITELCMKIKSGKSLTSTQFADVQVDVQRYAPVWNGTTWVDGPVNRCVDAMADALKDTDYGGSVPDTQQDLAKILAYQSATGNSLNYNGQIRGPVSLWEAAKTIMFNFRAEPVRIGSGYSFVRDETKAVRRHTFTRRQIVRGSTAIDYQVEADNGVAHVIVAYNKDGDPKQPYTAEAYYGVPSSTPRRYELPVTTYEAAVEIARWLAASGYYRRRKVTFQTELAGRLILRGDPIAVDTWFVNSRQVSGALSLASTTITLDTGVTVVSGDYAMLRDPNGLEWGPVRVTQGADARQIVLNAADVAAEATETGVTLASAIAPPENIPTAVVIGALTEHTEQWLVESCMPKEKGKTAIVAKIDSASVYSAVGDTITPVSPIALTFTTSETPSIRTFTPVIYNDGAAITLSFAITAEAGASRYEVYLSTDGGTDYVEVYDGTASSARVQIGRTDTAVYLKARAYGSGGLPGAFTAPVSATVPPPVVLATELTPEVVAWESLNAANQTAMTELAAQIASAKELAEVIAASMASLDETQRQDATTNITLLRSVQGQAEAKRVLLATAMAAADAAIVTTVDALTATVGTNTANITTVQTAQVKAGQAFAGLGIDVNAIGGAGDAGGYLRIAATVAAGVLAVLKLGVSTTVNGATKTAAMELSADATNTLIALIADFLTIKKADGTVVAQFDTGAGVFKLINMLLVAGKIQDSAGNFVIDLNYPKLTIKDSLGNVRVVLGKLD